MAGFQVIVCSFYRGRKIYFPFSAVGKIGHFYSFVFMKEITAVIQPGNEVMLLILYVFVYFITVIAPIHDEGVLFSVKQMIYVIKAFGHLDIHTFKSFGFGKTNRVVEGDGMLGFCCGNRKINGGISFFDPVMRTVMDVAQGLHFFCIGLCNVRLIFNDQRIIRDMFLDHLRIIFLYLLQISCVRSLPGQPFRCVKGWIGSSKERAISERSTLFV